jgi:selenocysteine lyase/cysteine desulfurase
MENAAKPLMEEPDWQSLRQRFPVFENKTYINSCSYGALSVDVIDAYNAYMDNRLTRGSDWEEWVGRNETVRARLARFLGAQPDEVAVTTSASAGLNALASALQFGGKRNKVVISDYEFPTTAQIWYAQEPRGAKVVRAEEFDGYVSPEQYEKVIDDETLLVVVTQVCFKNGALLDVPAIAKIAKERGAMLLVDGYQGLGTVEFDVSTVQPDFVVGGTVKYLLGSAGLGFLYIKQSLIEGLVPTTSGWFAQADIMAMDNTQHVPSPTARRFEAGTPPVPNCYAAEAGLRIIEEVGVENIVPRIRVLTTAIKDEARQAGYNFGMPDSPGRHAAMITLQSNDEHGLVAALENDGIVTSCRGGNLRISPHFYNDTSDVVALFRALKSHEALLIT